MTIAAHITCDKHTGKSFLFESLSRLAVTYTDAHFIFFTDKANKYTANPQKNCTYVLVSPKIKNTLSRFYWYNYKLPVLLKRYDAGVFLTEDGMLSLRTRKAQMMIISDVELLKKLISTTGQRRAYPKKFFISFLKIASAVLLTEKHIAETLALNYPVISKKCTLIHHGLNENYKPITWEQKQEITVQYTENKDYFIYPVSAGTKNNIINVLKAFSQFKKWQKSNMQLLLLVQAVPGGELIKDFHLYKYRTAVKIIEQKNDQQAALITASAYAVIYLPSVENTDDYPLNAMNCEVPVISIENNLTKDIYNKAVVYTLNNSKSISEKMMLLYKDENLRKDCIQQGLQLTARYSWDNTTHLLWQNIEKVMPANALTLQLNS